MSYLSNISVIKENLTFVNNTQIYRLSSTIGGSREMDQLYTTSQVSNITSVKSVTSVT